MQLVQNVANTAKIFPYIYHGKTYTTLIDSERHRSHCHWHRREYLQLLLACNQQYSQQQNSHQLPVKLKEAKSIGR
jgi:hypothetical protein